MRTFLRVLRDHRSLWRRWLPLLIIAAIQPFLAVATPLAEKVLIDDAIVGRHLDRLGLVAAAYGGLWIVGTILQTPKAILQTQLAEFISAQFRQRMFAHCEALSVAFAHREHSGRTMSLFVGDVPAISGLFSSTVATWLSNGIGVTLGAVAMYKLNPHLALVAGLLPVVVAAVGAAVTRPIRAASRRAQEAAGELGQRIQEYLSGLREVVAFGQGKAEGVRFAATLADLRSLRLRVTYMDRALQGGQSVFSLGVTLAILVYGGYLVIHGRATLGTLVAMRTLFSLTLYPAGQFLGLFSGVQRALASADRIYAFLDEVPRVRERPGALDPGDTAGMVAFEGVRFGYEPGRMVLRDLTFSARPGEVVALVGPSGAGKSTLASLIARFYDPEDGRVLLDGRDLRDLTLSGLRSKIAFVFQDPFLFAGSVRENIAFGRRDSDDDEIVAAARAAHAWEFIEGLPEGLETMVGERGVRLSAGQRQRLAIARALLRDPRILILDEPTAALDARSEQLVQAALENLMRGRTTFVIAHRLATVRRADRILVLDRGRLVEQGTHATLLRRDGLYRELHDLQFGGTHPPAPADVLRPLLHPDEGGKDYAGRERLSLSAIPSSGT